MRKLRRSFFQRDALHLAPDLIGKILVHRYRYRHDDDGDAGCIETLRARIVETEAYVGPHDLACHAAKGRTARTEVMFGRAGHAYVYFIYGMYDMLNIVAAAPGDAQAVLIRAAEPLDGWDADLSGPGKLARQMKITRAAHNTLDLTGNTLFLLEDPAAPKPRIATSKRIGVEYAGKWKDELLRFYDANSKAVSKFRIAPPRKRKSPDSPRKSRKSGDLSSR